MEGKQERTVTLSEKDWDTVISVIHYGLPELNDEAEEKGWAVGGKVMKQLKKQGYEDKSPPHRKKLG